MIVSNIQVVQIENISPYFLYKLLRSSDSGNFFSTSYEIFYAAKSWAIENSVQNLLFRQIPTILSGNVESIVPVLANVLIDTRISIQATTSFTTSFAPCARIVSIVVLFIFGRRLSS